MSEPRANDGPNPDLPKSVGPWPAMWRRFRRSRTGMIGLGWVAFLFLVALLGPLLANEHPIVCRFNGRIYFPALVDALRVVPKPLPFRKPTFDYRAEYDPTRGDWQVTALVPHGPTELISTPLQAPSSKHWLGTDGSGRDVFARLIHGSGISLRVGLISMGIAAVIGMALGAFAGFYRGWIDIVVSRLMEIFLCFPTLFLILAVLAWLPPRIENVMVVIGLTRWVSIARFTRAEFIRLRNLEFVIAARALGAGSQRLILRHLLPNSLAPVLVNVTFGVSVAILIEAALSWIGLGVDPTTPSWGGVLKEGDAAITVAPHIILSACVAIFLTVLAVNLVGDGLRDAIDPKAAPVRTRRGAG